MMKILGLLRGLLQTTNERLLKTVCTGVTTSTVNSVPSTIYNGPALSGSFLFATDADQSAVNGQRTTDNGQQSTNNSQKELSNVNDELGQKKPGLTYDRPKWLVNDDLAACSSLEACSSQLTASSNNIFPSKPHNNGPAGSGSFVFFIKDFIQRSFTAVELFKKIKPGRMKNSLQLIPVRYVECNSKQINKKIFLQKPGYPQFH